MSCCSAAKTTQGLLCDNPSECEGYLYVHLKVTFTHTVETTPLKDTGLWWALRQVCAVREDCTWALKAHRPEMSGQSSAHSKTWTRQEGRRDQVFPVGVSQDREMGLREQQGLGLVRGSHMTPHPSPCRDMAPGHPMPGLQVGQCPTGAPRENPGQRGRLRWAGAPVGGSPCPAPAVTGPLAPVGPECQRGKSELHPVQ